MKISVIIPVLNEEESIGKVIDNIPSDLVQEIIVVDNGSNDKTAEVARKHGATVLFEPKRGYGSTCMKGVNYLNDTDIVVFLDGDYSDHPDEMRNLVKPILEGQADLVLGSRVLGKREKGSMKFQQIFGNWLATFLIRILFGHRYTDLGPFRAVRYDKLQEMNMEDRSFGLTVEMQVKALLYKLRVREVPVSYRKRIGKSKISGTILGTIRAGWMILYTIFKYAVLERGEIWKKT